MGDDCKPVFSTVGCLYIKASVWKKSTSLSRVSVYEVPSCTPPFRLVLTSVATGDIQINTPIAPQLGVKRSRDDFVFFTVRYAGADALVSYGVQLRDRKFAEQLLAALNLVAQKKDAAAASLSASSKKLEQFEISKPNNFRLVQHTGPPIASAPAAGGDLLPGWSAATTDDGRTYYFNGTETTWERPAAPPAAAGLPRASSSTSSSAGVGFAGLPDPRRSSSGGGGDASPAVMAAAQRLLETLPPTLRRVEAGQVHVGAAIGKGCYGTVYEGKWQGRAVAVKQLDVSSRQAGGGEKSLKEFEVEARLMHRISEHPNVLSIIGILVALPQLSIVMEFMELTDLYAVLTSGDSISVSMEDLWIKGIANGLRHIARSGIIHRDIAARNVLLNRDYHPKIADFGLAIAHEENRAMEETAVNKWLSPEAISERVYTFKSDVWSYGVTVWEVVTKQIPYPGIDPMMACMRIVGDGLSPEIPADCAELHAQVMRACFIFDQHQRASIEQVCQILNI
jgi:tRNA A-37 threonylcarbamoyl transferase component Bud32